MTKAETIILSTLTGAASLITILAYIANYLTPWQSILILFLSTYTILLLYIVLKTSNIEKMVKVNTKFAKLGDELIRYSLEQYLNYQKHGNLGQLIDAIILKSTQLHHLNISSIIFKDVEDFDLSPDRLHKLLERYKNGTITEAEAWELKQLLEEEKAKKEKKGQEAEALLIGLILIGILLWLASRKE